MQMIPQFARLSHSPVSSRVYPPTHPTPLLTAPKIAGLLPAPVGVQIVIERRPTWADVMRQLGPIHSREEMQAEIRTLCFAAAGAIYAAQHAMRGGCA